MEQIIKIGNLKDMFFYIGIEHYSSKHLYTHTHTHEELGGGNKEYPNAYYLFFQYYCYFPFE